MIPKEQCVGMEHTDDGVNARVKKSHQVVWRLLHTMLGFRHWIRLCQALKLLMPTRFRAAFSWDLKAGENSAT